MTKWQCEKSNFFFSYNDFNHVPKVKKCKEQKRFSKIPFWFSLKRLNIQEVRLNIFATLVKLFLSFIINTCIVIKRFSLRTFKGLRFSWWFLFLRCLESAWQEKFITGNSLWTFIKVSVKSIIMFWGDKSDEIFLYWISVYNFKQMLKVH